MTENGHSTNVKRFTVAYCDGCFDFLHYGHANQIRQAKETADYLVVGTHTDEEIGKHKAVPVFLQEERYRMLKALKWADKIVYDAPFSPSINFLNENNCDFCVHGNDFSITADGDHTYNEVKKAGRYIERKRMPGVSTTDLIERILYLQDERNNNSTKQVIEPGTLPTSYGLNISPWTRGYPFVPSSELLHSFSDGNKKQQPSDVVVYVAGTFDVFHVGHLAFLEEAAKLGTYLIVGVHTDSVVKDCKGMQFPILSLHERVLNLLSYKCVSDVLIGAPYVITSAMMDHFNISLVCHGVQVPVDVGVDPYQEPKNRGKFRLIDSKCNVTTETIFERVLNRRSELLQRNEKKETKERMAYDTMQNLQTGETWLKR